MRVYITDGDEITVLICSKGPTVRDPLGTFTTARTFRVVSHDSQPTLELVPIAAPVKITVDEVNRMWLYDQEMLRHG